MTVLSLLRTPLILLDLLRAPDNLRVPNTLDLPAAQAGRLDLLPFSYLVTLSSTRLLPQSSKHPLYCTPAFYQYHSHSEHPSNPIIHQDLHTHTISSPYFLHTPNFHTFEDLTYLDIPLPVYLPASTYLCSPLPTSTYLLPIYHCYLLILFYLITNLLLHPQSITYLSGSEPCEAVSKLKLPLPIENFLRKNYRDPIPIPIDNASLSVSSLLSYQTGTCCCPALSHRAWWGSPLDNERCRPDHH